MEKLLIRICVVVILAFVFVVCDNSIVGDNNLTKIFTVTFDLDDGNIDGDTGPVKITVEYGETISNLPNPEKTDYIFDGWFSEKYGNGSEFTPTTAVTSDMTVYAKWTPAIPEDILLTVTFDLDGGDIYGDTTSVKITVISGKTISSLPYPQKAGEIFGGWFSEKNGSGDKFTTTTIVESDITVFAHWKLPVGIEGISFENYPIFDGSTSTYSFSQLIACKFLDIPYYWSTPYPPTEWALRYSYNDLPEQHRRFFADKVLRSQTHGAFLNLIDGNADIILNHRTMSPDEKAYADAAGVTLIETPIALDAFDFIVNKYNPVRTLTADQIQKIYTEEITNWSELGGKNTDIQVFTRPRNSGSEEVFRTLVMDGIEPADFPAAPISSMMGVFPEVRSYEDAICYTFHAYKEIEAQFPDNEVPKIAINDIFPTENTIADGSYPFIIEVYVAIRSDLDRNSMAYKLYEWLQTDNVNPLLTECGFIVPGSANGGSITSDFLFNPATGTITKYTGNGSAVTIPSVIDGVTVTAIGNDAFSYNASLTSTNIPNTVTSIGAQAFMNCIRLTSVTIPSSVTTIGAQAFINCSSLTDITIPNSVSLLDRGVFASCTSLANVNIANGITSIGVSAFEGCTSLTGVTIPASVTAIGDSAFMNCIKLTSLIMSNGVTSIGADAFRDCTSLTDVTIPVSVTSIGADAFRDCSSLVGITLPSNVTTIGDRAFFNCIKLTDITIPNSVTSIGYRAFSFTALANITIESGDIGICAFADCTSLTSLTIGNGVTSIDNYAFDDCTSLASVTFQGTIRSGDFSSSDSFPGDLRSKFFAVDASNGTPGTYTTASPGENPVWFRQP